MPTRKQHSSGKVLRLGAASAGFRQRTALPDEDGAGELLRNAIQRAREGDRDALTFLYVRYADNIYGYVRSIVRDEHEAEDITQQLFYKLPSALSRYERHSVPFSAWILRVARSRATTSDLSKQPTTTWHSSALAHSGMRSTRSRASSDRC